MESTLVQRHIPCPSCPSSDAYCVYSDGHGYCFSCKLFVKGDHVNEDDGECTYEFYGRRGITKESFRHFSCQTKIDREGKPVSVGYKYPNGAVKVRTLDNKEFYWTGTPSPGLYGRNLFASGSNKYVTITEGEEDAHSLWQVLRSPVCSVQSSSSALRDCVADREWLAGFDRIYIAFDNDGQGREAMGRVAKLFDPNKVYVVRFTNRKDANEYLIHGEEQVLLNVWSNARRYVPENVVSTFAEFEEILSAEVRQGIPFPWPTLTEKTGGIRTHESILVTAPEGVGKTEWMKAVEAHILRETDYNVGAIFIEEPKDGHLQSLVGIEKGSPIHLPTHTIPVSEQVSALRDLLKRDERLHIYSHFGSDDPNTLLETIRFLVTARSCRIIFLDHITMAVSGLAGEDERRALDYLSTRLEMMLKELGFALIVVSHVNDEGKTRGSRLISKLADIRLDLSRDFLHPDPAVKCIVTQTITKPSRFTGQSGFAGSLKFDPMTRRFTEISDGYPSVEGESNVIHLRKDTGWPKMDEVVL